MKVVAFNVPKIKKEAFRLQEDRGRFFYDQLHQHPEIQIMLIQQGGGTLIAGDYVGRFGPGDIFVIGSRLPHVFRSDQKYYQSAHPGQSRAVSIYFNESYWGRAFWELDELAGLRKFADRSARALVVKGKAKDEIASQIGHLHRLQGMEKLIAFFTLLKQLIELKTARPLALAPLRKGYNPEDGKRMNAILAFTFAQCHRRLYIKEVADVAHLSVEAFCRYFKMHTQKTYTAFLNEVRVSHACQLLISGDLTVADVGYQSGFNNISNFNRVFKRITGKTPSRYLK